MDDVAFDADTDRDKVASDTSDASDASDKGSGKSGSTIWQPDEIIGAAEVSSECTVKDAQQQAVLRDRANLRDRKRAPRRATLSKIGSDPMKPPPAKTRLARSQSTQTKRSGIRPPRPYNTSGVMSSLKQYLLIR